MQPVLGSGVAPPASLGNVPQEVLEHIAFFAATQSLVGPPSGLPPLLLTCRSIHCALSFEANPYLYARIFSCKFDTSSAFRRLGARINTPLVLANELKKRCAHLKRIRARTKDRRQYPESHHPSPSLIDSLWLSYLMMLENDGKNERQLLDYAEMDVWLMEYWFDDDGASEATHMIARHAWPVADEKNALAMWLFWFLFRPNLILQNVARLPYIKTIVKLIALAANHYPLCYPSWTEFLPRPEATLPPSVITHFAEAFRLSPPTLAPAAVLVFLTLALRILVPTRENYAGGLSLQSPASFPLIARQSDDWDTEWYRCINLGRSEPGRRRALSEAYVLGSSDGVWEGVFTYTEFSAYSSLLSGGAPLVLDHCLVAHHRQTWKLREYYLVQDRDPGWEQPQPLGPGDPLRAHFPMGTRILQELSDSIAVQEPGKDAVHYRRISRDDHRNVADVIILGEGHSAWGQFNLCGRVRPLDGLISLSKEYVQLVEGDDRGRWLYRGYLVGNANGHISGRWRDTLSPRELGGYEGCFVMSRRR